MATKKDEQTAYRLVLAAERITKALPELRAMVERGGADVERVRTARDETIQAAHHLRNALVALEEYASGRP